MMVRKHLKIYIFFVLPSIFGFLDQLVVYGMFLAVSHSEQLMNS